MWPLLRMFNMQRAQLTSASSSFARFMSSTPLDFPDTANTVAPSGNSGSSAPVSQSEEFRRSQARQPFNSRFSYGRQSQG